MRTVGTWLAMLAALLGIVQRLSAQDATDPRVDPATGRQAATWPPDRPFDHLHMRLAVTIPDMGKAELTGVQTLTLTPIGRPRSELVLDNRGPAVSSVTASGIDLPFAAEGGKLRITFPAAIGLGQTVVLTIHYTLDFSKNRGEGLTWSRGRDDATSLTRQAPQIHAQGQAQLNSLWFPCHDFPNEALTTELIVDVEDGYDVVSNGSLASRVSANGRTVWHWVQDKPHAYYLVTVAVGKFAIGEVGGDESARPGLAMPVYVNHGFEENVAPIFGGTPKMVATFERLFDEPYPWAKYAQVCVRSFAAGGMENTSCTLLTEGTGGAGEAGSRDDLISHELAHQWFGDLMTCKGWAHLWLNEGWASYAECLWEEAKAGDDPAAARRAYQRAVLGYVRAQRSRNRSSAPDVPPVVSNRYTDPDGVFSKRDDPYAKGAVILHMLRERLGDHAFFKGVHDYIDKYKFSFVETDQFRRSLERASGESLERFFEQWCMRPGLPRLGVDLDWDESASTLTVHLEQSQTIDRLNPAYALALPIRVRYEDGTTEWHDLFMETREATGTYRLKGKPSQVNVDPNITCFSAVEVRKPLAWWMEEAVNGPTLAARVQAVEALAVMDDEAARMLAAKVAGEAGVDPMIREAAAGLVVTVTPSR
ncbi:MAG: hypothetical protein HBSAPP03_21160 [Phycisphaerae bacterium]|nr:MAG: hypothetical protein HBSAPP03_21160 [Phycisphaerae bacterium]